MNKNVIRTLCLFSSMAAAILALMHSAHSTAADSPDKVIQTVKDFTDPKTPEVNSSIINWNWPSDLKEDASKFSQLRTVDYQGTRALSITVTSEFPWKNDESIRALPIGPDLLPPNADAVAIRCRAVEGSFTISVGGPTVYFGHSDVTSAPITITSKVKNQDRTTLVLSLNELLVRNFRRAGVAKDAPVIYYTRWIQEPMYLYIHKGSAGTLLLEKVDLINKGQGKPLPTFEPGQLTHVTNIEDFSDAKSLSRVFRGIHQPVDMSGPPKLARTSWKPPVISHQDQGSQNHQGVLICEQKGTEEVAFSGIKLSGESKANAIAVDIKVSSPRPLPEISVDWLLYNTPPNTPLDYDKFLPPESWRGNLTSAFDLYLTPEATGKESLAMFHARSAVPNGKWTTILLPMPDFTCVYSTGSMANVMRSQSPASAEQAVTLCWLPSFRHHREPTTFEIDNIRWVKLPGTDESLKSFHQVDPSKVILIPWGGRGLKQMVPADASK